MAKLLISCDDYIFHHKGKYYFKNQEWYDFYQRYLRVFEKLKICNRVINEKEGSKNRIHCNDPRIEIHPIPIFHGPAQYTKSYFAIGRAMKSAIDGCDAAVLRLPSTVAQRLSKQIIKAGIPYATEIVFDAHDGADTANSFIEKILWRIIDKQMQTICANAYGVSCVTSNYLQQRYFSLKSDHFESNYSTLALDRSFFTGPRHFPNKKVLTIAHVDLQIGLHSRKGTDIIILALAKLKKKGIIVNIKFAGEDWDNSTQKILAYAKKHGIEEQVECTGFLNRQQLDEYLNNSDLFVLPTKAEGLPRVIIEAIAKGMPTVTTPASGNSELIPAHYLVDFYDVDTLAERIEELATNKDTYEQVSKVNYEHSLQYEASILQRRRDEFYTKLKYFVT
ncbi:glycosyltransferase [Macellibacteroides fermentans]|uniref:glycosyltransferase n=1 Tax=Macellibacteroides fermentans TaxID=879969 RepID=UPI00406C2FB3